MNMTRLVAVSHASRYSADDRDKPGHLFQATVALIQRLCPSPLKGYVNVCTSVVTCSNDAKKKLNKSQIPATCAQLCSAKNRITPGHHDKIWKDVELSYTQLQLDDARLHQVIFVRGAILEQRAAQLEQLSTGVFSLEKAKSLPSIAGCANHHESHKSPLLACESVSRSYPCCLCCILSTLGDVHNHGGIPIAGWFISWKLPKSPKLKWMIAGGCPHFGNLHMSCCLQVSTPAAFHGFHSLTMLASPSPWCTSSVLRFFTRNSMGPKLMTRQRQRTESRTKIRLLTFDFDMPWVNRA